MKTYFNFLFSLPFILFFLGIHVQLAAQETLSVSVLNGTEIRCYPDSLVRIEITPNTDFQFSNIYVDWGDGSDPLVLNPGDNLILEHEYPLAQFLDDCTYGEGCPGFVDGFCFNLTIDAEYGGDTQPENIAKRLTFLFPPRPNFAPDDSFICAEQEFCLANFTCPENDGSMVFEWTFPDGSTSDEVNPCYTFPTAGVYPITLMATNDCGTITTTRNVTVNALPIAEAVLDSGSVNFQMDLYTVCLGSGGKVRLNGDASSNATSYDWTFTPSTGVTILQGMNNDTACVRFTMPGTYTATLGVNNPCDAPDETSLQIEVVAPPSLSVDPQVDECLSLMYSPAPLSTTATYTLNGVAYTAADFPLNLMTSSDPYTLLARDSNICGVVTRRDTFIVFGPSDPMITMPTADTMVCRDSSLLLLSTDGLGDGWQVDTGVPLVEMNGQVFFDLDQASGDYVVSFSQGFGACEGMDSRTITIQSPQVSLDGPWEFCADGAVETLTASPAGGSWSGSGVVDAGTGAYDPTSVPPGTYDVFYTFTDASVTGCTVTLSSTVMVVALPEIMGMPANFSVCEIDAQLLLPDLLGVSLNPMDGVTSWQADGVVDPTTGTYNPTLVMGGMDTVILVYEIAPGCRRTDTTFVTIDAITPVDAGPDLTVCDSEDNPILTASPDGQGTWDGIGIDPMTGEVDLAQLTVGQTYSYEYIINADFPPCRNSDFVELTLASGQGVTIMPDELYICDTATFVVLPPASSGTGVWQGSPAISNDTLFLGLLPAGTLSLAYVEPSLPAACNSAELTVYYSEQPTVGFQSDSTACVDVDCLPFEAITGGAETFVWDFGNGSGATDAQTCHIYNTTGVFQVSLTGYLLNPLTNEQYCASDPATAPVEILGALADVNIIASAPADCPDFFVDLSPSVTSVQNSYSWTVAGIVDSMTNSLQNVLLPAVAQDTAYLAYLSTSNGCDTQLDSISLIAIAPLRAAVATDFDFPCSGDTVSLYNLSTGLSGNTPRWLIDGVPFDGFEPPSFQVFTDTLPRLLEVILIDANDCNADTAFYTIEVQPTDVRARMNYSSPEVCASTDLELINISTPGAVVRWETSDGNNYLGDTVLHRFTTPGPAWVLIYAEGCGYDSLRYDFEVLPPPELSLDVDPVACAEAPVAFTVGGNADGQTLYYGTGDSTFLNISNYIYPEPNEYTIRLIGASSAGCIDSLQSSIVINGLPEAIVLPIDSVCAGEPILLISQSIDAESCLWQLADNGSRDQCISEYTFFESGLQNNRLVVTSSLGCRDSVDFPVFVRPTPNADFDFVGGNDCSPAIVQFVYNNTNPVPTSWDWTFGDGNSSIAVSPEHIYGFGGNYTVQLITGIDGICYDTLVQEIPVRGTPRLDTLVIDERCLPTDAFVLEVQTDEENEITVTGDNFQQAGINRFEIVPPGDYELEILSPSGCDTTLNFVVPEVFPLTVSLMPDTTILLGASIKIVSEVNASDIIHFWTPIEGLNDTTLLEPISTPLSTTTYFLAVTDGMCSAVDTVTIFVNEDVQVYFPNAFSPNDDGINDIYTFYPAIGVEHVNSFQMYNRWGGLVYEILDMPPAPAGVQTWDGMLRGKPVNPDTFVYVAELRLTDGRTVLFKGSVHLVR